MLLLHLAPRAHLKASISCRLEPLELLLHHLRPPRGFLMSTHHGLKGRHVLPHGAIEVPQDQQQRLPMEV